uniref:ANK_REP_REGION domain-containing protein n=1 Tax=Macrostomum lignano TaxID=282301 RepID=A0A1I8HGV1_9PLAT
AFVGALKGRNKEIVCYIVKSKFKPDFTDPDILHYLANEALHGDFELIEFIFGELSCVEELQEPQGISDVDLRKECAEIIAAVLYKSMSEGFVSLASAVIKYANISYLYKGGLTCLMVAALAGHHELVKQILGSPDTDIDAVDETGQSALAKACVRGHLRVAMTLLDSGANLKLTDHRGRDCLHLARLYRHRDLLRLLQYRLKFKSTSEQPEIIQSPGNHMRGESLSRILSSAGFTRERAEQQQRMADFLETLARIITKDGRCMTGSYADGWGNSLKQVNGLTAADSDIDWTVIVGSQDKDEDKIRKLVFHLESCCRCGDVQDRPRIIDGHAQMQSPGGSQPAVAADACGVRPAEDTCHAYQCCGSLTHPNRVEKLLPAGALAMKVHLVTATRPNSDNEMRVSFSFHEKKIMRDLSETQGQLFVLIKFIFKRLLPRYYNLSGLKTYHARTLMFFILHTFPSDSWSRENLRSLLAKALNTMLELMEEKGCTDI